MVPLCRPVHSAPLSAKGRAHQNTFSGQPEAGVQNPVLNLTKHKGAGLDRQSQNPLSSV